MLQMTSLCAAWKYYIADGVVALFFLISIITGAKKGFFRCIFGVISTLAAVILAIMGAKIILSATNGLFGFQNWAYGKFLGVFSKWEGFSADISGIGLDAALQMNTMPAIVAKLILKIAGTQTELAAGTTLAQLLGNATASLASLLLAGISIFVVIKLLFIILKRILNSAAEESDAVGGINAFFGGLLGGVYAVFIVSVVLSVLAVFPFNAVTGYLSETLLVGKLYVHNPLVYVLGLFL